VLQALAPDDQEEPDSKPSSRLLCQRLRASAPAWTTCSRVVQRSHLLSQQPRDRFAP
jgi:hypothetical protein